MDVLILPKGIDKQLVLRYMGEHTQLDLGIVGGYIEEPVLRHEGLPYFPAFHPFHGDILEVGIAARQAARGDDHLVEGGMDPAGRLMDQCVKAVHIGALQLRQHPVLEYLGGQGVKVGERVEHLVVR